MEVFVRGVPPDYGEDSLHALFRPYLQALGVDRFLCKKLFTKTNCATLLIPDLKAAVAFLHRHGKPEGFTRSPIPIRTPLGRILICEQSRNPPDAMAMKRLRLQASKQSDEAVPKKPSESKHKFDVAMLDCGIWDYDDAGLCFHSCYRDRRPGFIFIGRRAAVVILQDASSENKTARMLIRYHTIDQIVAANRDIPSVTFSLYESPRFYEISPDRETSSEMSPGGSKLLQERIKRTCNLDKRHASAAGSCLVYRITLSNGTSPEQILKTLRSLHGAPRTLLHRTPIRVGRRDYNHETHSFSFALSKSSLPYLVKFQLLRLACNGYLTPLTLLKMLPNVTSMASKSRSLALAQSIHSLSRVLPYPGPGTQRQEFLVDKIVAKIRHGMDDFSFKGSIFENARRYEHQAIIHRIKVTPSGTYLEGPDLEVKNRVLRKYSKHEDCFIRVEFSDEDYERVAYEPRVDLGPVLREKFKDVLDDGISIFDRLYRFLGFSHSSLRSQQCWFMAPFWSNELKIPTKVISELGDFSHFQSPAKCAARIGQAFSDATEFIALEPGVVETILDVERNGRTFTDGVGIASREIFRSVWKKFSRSKKRHATLLQIRYQGSKGLLALDSSLSGKKIFMRRSMNKFKGSEADVNLEICGAGYNRLPMFLNKSLISILEARGADTSAILELQALAVRELTTITESPVNAARYLETNFYGNSARLPSLIRLLDDIGLDYRRDRFLTGCLEIATIVQLRDLKHRGRIPVPKAFTLLGTVDETGLLAPDEVYVATKGDHGFTQWLEGAVAVTRSPALHPGDIQVCEAVVPPESSQMRELFNCVIFSQNGDRDLPSQLSGGDLDGDLYNVIFDERLFPKWATEAADYPRVPARSIDRRVEPSDMSNFFIEFMETDRLGYISNLHMQAADQFSTSAVMRMQRTTGAHSAGNAAALPVLKQGDSGLYHSDSMKLSELASTAVDFSKSGVPVSQDFARFEKSRPRPRTLRSLKAAVTCILARYKPADEPTQIDMAVVTGLKSFNRNMKPDFMANAPSLILDLNSRLSLLEDSNGEENSDPLSTVLNPGRQPTRYYESPMILGRLYRAIDETKFLDNMQAQLDATQTRDDSLISTLDLYIKSQTKSVQWKHHCDFAKKIRRSYEEMVVNNMWAFSPHHNRPLLEREVLCGTILGRAGGIPSRKMRESNLGMRDQFNQDVTNIIDRMLHGDEDEDEETYAETESGIVEYMNNLSIRDTKRGFGGSADSEKLARTLACFMTSMSTGKSYSYVGPIKSFTYVAAALCLKELEAFRGGRLAPVGHYYLPN